MTSMFDEGRALAGLPVESWGKVRCPQCGERVYERGLRTHIAYKHGTQPSESEPRNSGLT